MRFSRRTERKLGSSPNARMSPPSIKLHSLQSTCMLQCNKLPLQALTFINHQTLSLEELNLEEQRLFFVEKIYLKRFIRWPAVQIISEPHHVISSPLVDSCKTLKRS